MPDNISKSVILSLLPKGEIWNLKSDGDFDLLLDGMAENNEEIRIFLSKLAYVREPQKTEILSDLEKEFGIINKNLTEQERRNRLGSAKYLKNSDGSRDHIQNRLRTAGFDIFVYDNDPPVDPSQFVNANFKTICGSSIAICGAAGVICGTANSNQLLVNGDLIFHSESIQQVVCGNFGAISGNSQAVCGRKVTVPDTNNVTYELPVSPGYDHLIFFIGGEVTRDPVTDEILLIEPAQISASRRDELESIILKYKPMHSWCGLIVEYTL